jgi:hypothetical protein
MLPRLAAAVATSRRSITARTGVAGRRHGRALSRGAHALGAPTPTSKGLTVITFCIVTWLVVAWIISGTLLHTADDDSVFVHLNPVEAVLIAVLWPAWVPVVIVGVILAFPYLLTKYLNDKNKKD